MEKMNPEQRKPFLQPSTAKGRKRKSYEEKAEVRKKCDQYRNQRRVNIGESFDQWRKLRTDLGLTTDAETAELLLNSYERNPSLYTLQKQGTMRPALPALSAKTNKSPSDWTCSVIGCDSGRRSAQRYKLPEDPDMRLNWVQFLLEVNGQQLRESSWTDITICSEHFTQDCYDNQTAQLKFEAAPSLCIKPEPEDHLKSPHVVDSTVGDLDTYNTPSVSPTHYPNPMQQKVTTGMKREEAALLQIDKTFLLTEHGLLKLFVHKCPSCDHDLQLEQVAKKKLIVVNQQCHRCNYRFQWKSRANAGIPTVEHQTGGSEETPECQQATPEVEEIDMEENQSDDPMYNDLCAECGIFFNRRRPHICEYRIKPLYCNICGKKCNSEQGLRSHSRTHNAICELACKYCFFTLKTKADKMTHKAIHATEEKPYKCPDCPETFASSKERYTHQEVHKPPQKYTCDVCGMDFLNPRSLRRHMLVHTGLKRHKCSICNRAFKQRGHLKSHMRQHTGERPYKCWYCKKCFTHNVSLKSHIQRDHHKYYDVEEDQYKRKENVDSDLDFIPAGVKKQSHSSQNSAEGSLRRRGRPKKKN